MSSRGLGGRRLVWLPAAAQVGEHGLRFDGLVCGGLHVFSLACRQANHRFANHVRLYPHPCG
ncbi:hypothetical protein BN13_1080016 [Nostocoides jenkinsii Ben 74]|uniref:Uncharacterized protein n=1 Tax=Nostocoides jenkinsii Ben 74 TaxID=1193518 RepID=A0A077M9Z9_9MICO|nr:hypothetical protein BN13_1080016 [Tetrasphaera jenkinsii Ben 74]